MHDPEGFLSPICTACYRHNSLPTPVLRSRAHSAARPTSRRRAPQDDQPVNLRVFLDAKSRLMGDDRQGHRLQPSGGPAGYAGLQLAHDPISPYPTVWLFRWCGPPPPRLESGRPPAPRGRGGFGAAAGFGLARAVCSSAKQPGEDVPSTDSRRRESSQSYGTDCFRRVAHGTRDS
jgi:hypothetical protein